MLSGLFSPHWGFSLLSEAHPEGHTNKPNGRSAAQNAFDKNDYKLRLVLAHCFKNCVVTLGIKEWYVYMLYMQSCVSMCANTKHTILLLVALLLWERCFSHRLLHTREERSEHY